MPLGLEWGFSVPSLEAIKQWREGFWTYFQSYALEWGFSAPSLDAIRITERGILNLLPKLRLGVRFLWTFAQRDKNNGWHKPPVIFMAEREGFEPSCACAQTDFESAPLWPLRYLSISMMQQRASYLWSSMRFDSMSSAQRIRFAYPSRRSTSSLVRRRVRVFSP